MMFDSQFHADCLELTGLGHQLYGKYSVVVGPATVSSHRDLLDAKYDEGLPYDCKYGPPYPVVRLANRVLFDRYNWLVPGPWQQDLPAMVRAAIQGTRTALEDMREATRRRELAVRAAQREVLHREQEQAQQEMLAAWNKR